MSSLCKKGQPDHYWLAFQHVLQLNEGKMPCNKTKPFRSLREAKGLFNS